jgi:transposase
MRNHAYVSYIAVKSSKPRLILHELLTHLLEDVPDKLVKQKSVEDELLCIINSQSEHLQKATYKLLRTNIVEKAQDLAAGLEFSHNEGKTSCSTSISC